MARVAGYRIEDEPRPGPLATVAVDPIWPLFALMFAGGWLAFPWFVLNGIAVGSPTRGRELAWAVAGLAGSLALAFAIVAAIDSGWLATRAHAQFALLLVTLWKLGVGYALTQLQGNLMELHEHYGGRLRNGLPVVLVGALLFRPPLLAALEDPALRFALS